MTPFLLEDAHGVARRLKANREGSYKVDKSRSALALTNTKSFPKNTEFEALITFTGTPEGVGDVRNGDNAELGLGNKLLHRVEFISD